MSNCPICSKAGLPNYKEVHVICPQCNTDLKPFLLINSISKTKVKSNGVYFVAAIAVVIIATLGTIFYSSSNNVHSQNESFERNLKTAQILHDSIKALRFEIDSMRRIDKSRSEVILAYKVKVGDYPSRIAEYFYNDWRMFRKIEKDNNLNQPYVLKVGQVIYIKIRPKQKD